MKEEKKEISTVELQKKLVLLLEGVSAGTIERETALTMLAIFRNLIHVTSLELEIQKFKGNDPVGVQMAG